MDSIFNYYPESIFSPLSNKNKKIYWSVIERLFHAYFDESAEVLEATISPKQIRKEIEQSLAITKDEYEVEEDDVAITSLEGISTHAQLIYNKLKDTGWLKIEKEGVKFGVYMSPRIINLIDFFINTQSNTSENVGVSVISIYQSLQSIPSDNYTSTDIKSALLGALDNSKRMQRLMTNLSSEMLDVHEKIGEVNDLGEKTALYFNEFIKSAPFESLKSIKGSNHPYRFKAEIIEWLDKLEYTALNKSIIDKLVSGKEESRREIKEDYISKLRQIRKIFNNTAPLLDRIDRNHNKLVKRTNEAIRYQQRNSSKATEIFTHALESIKDLPVGKDDQLFIKSPHTELLGFIDLNFTIPKYKKPPIKTKIIPKARRLSKKKRIETQLYREYRTRLSASESEYLDWLNVLFSHHKTTELSSEDIQVNTIEDYIFFTLSRRLCKPSHQNKRKYKNTQERYEFSILSEGLEEHEISICRPFLLTKREH